MCVSRLRYVVRVLLGICVLAGSLLPARGAAVPCAATGEAVPHGVVVLLPSGEQNYRAMNLAVVKKPPVSGVAVQINWRDIEPVPGMPDWSQLDALFAAAESSKKWVHLIMFPGFFSPPWALEGAQTDQFESNTGQAKARRRGCRCRGIAFTSTAGSRSCGC